MKVKAAIDLMWINIKMVVAVRVEGRATALETVNYISLGEQKLRQIGAVLSRNTGDQRGFAHGFLVLSETAEFFYKCDNFYSKESEGGLLYNDPKLNIDWKIDLEKILLSEKDAILPPLGDHRTFE